ncbi:MAG: metalloregulator ArsR/SmtB family transcription factor [Clostridia bacterium]
MITEKDRKDIAYYLPDVNATSKLATFFSLFADSSRLRLISLLALCNMCVNDISQMLGMNQTTVSHQLKLLKQMQIVRSDRQGKTIFYSLSNTKINEVLLFGVEYLGY